MGLFSNKNKNYLGVNIGSSGIKVVELTRKDNEPQLVTYGYVEETTNVVKGDFSKTQAKTSALLKTVCDKARVSTKKAVAALPNFLVFSSIINVPASKNNNKEMEEAIKWEAKKFIPIPIEEVVLDWKLLESGDGAINSIVSDDKKNKQEADKEPENGVGQKEKPEAPMNDSPKPPGSSALDTPEKAQDKVDELINKTLNQDSGDKPKDILEPTIEKKEGENDVTTNQEIKPSTSFDATQDGSLRPGKTKNQLEDKKETPPKEENLNILLTAAPKDLVKKYMDICRAAGLELLSLETESFALGRSLIGKNSQPVMMINIGALISDIVVMEKGIPVLSRSIDVGGDTITQAIVNILNVDARRAEQFKRDFGAPMNARGVNFVGPGTGSQGAGMSGIPKAISAVLDSLLHEIRYSLELYQNQTNKKVEKVVLAGGSAFLPNFTNYLSDALSLSVQIGNPWDRIAYPTELKPILEDLAPRFAVAVGLALREIV